MAKKTKNKPDVRVHDCGSIVQLEILTPAGRKWVAENVESEGWQWLGNRLCIEPRMVVDIVAGMQSHLEVE
jgi:hypothetical protein